MDEASVKLSRNEELKTANPTLAGNIAATLADPAADHFSQDDYEFLKFHGVYQQDDRDLRKTGKKYIMMVRSAIPGGVLTAKQWIAMDNMAGQYGNNTLRITTRQTIQFHGIVKSNLRALMKGLNDALVSTIAACGDVKRNVMAPPTPAYTLTRSQVLEDCYRVTEALKPRTRAYHSIWIDGVQLNLEDPETKNFVDPLYGKNYLPRKFKVAFAIPPVNDIDLFTNCVGFIAIVEDGELIGYNLAMGGGLGRSHGNVQTYPRLADVIGFLTPDQVVEVAKATLTIHRDFGDRSDRKHARMKYIIAERGVDWARAEVEKRAGIQLEPARPYRFTTTGDLYGWREAVDGKWFLTLFVETGRVKDVEGRRMKTALRQVADRFSDIEFRLSPNQNVILANIIEEDRDAINEVLVEHGVKTDHRQTTPMHAAAMACPALPTCGLALAESERMLPGLVDRIEKLAEAVGMAGEEIIIRSTGCPNGCARPYVAELAFVGKAPGRYQIWLGGDLAATRLARLWKETVKDADIETELRPVLTRYVNERFNRESFGDWCDRVLLNEPVSGFSI
ncbi:MAG TPA: NADPH-dependent assimilatory sulfite reductase hemoprotein subunit [Candidatus Acidoferrales bacterium]|jgi:sulfite reductase (NADPH) hemoprotein beta-component|nr:NADPH-dependent assimilatory sulfite reductase hemoprotein subunit [Candidatus Acidoferrales bacterium]